MKFIIKMLHLFIVAGGMALLLSGISLSSTTLAECGTASLKTSIIKCPSGTNDNSTVITQTGFGSLLVMAIKIMTAGVGVLAVGGIVYGAVLYVSAGDSAEQVKRARTIIVNVVIGIIAYGLMYTILNFIIPGGLF